MLWKLCTSWHLHWKLTIMLLWPQNLLIPAGNGVQRAPGFSWFSFVKRTSCEVRNKSPCCALHQYCCEMYVRKLCKEWCIYTEHMFLKSVSGGWSPAKIKNRFFVIHEMFSHLHIYMYIEHCLIHNGSPITSLNGMKMKDCEYFRKELIGRKQQGGRTLSWSAPQWFVLLYLGGKEDTQASLS